MRELRAAARGLLSGSRPLRVAIISVFVLSGLARALLIAGAKPQLISDAFDYHAYARSLLAGEGYASTHTDRQKTAGRPAYEGFTFRAYRPPGYPVFLAVLYGIAGWHTRLALVANAAADLVTQICFLLIAYKLFGNRDYYMRAYPPVKSWIREHDLFKGIKQI